MTEPSGELTVTLEFDWGAGPFWVSAPDGGRDDYSAHDITDIVPLSDALLVAAEAWYQRMQRTYDDESPQEIGMRDPGERAKWVADGRELARWLKREVGPGVRVEYAPFGDDAESIPERPPE
ncbi:hypothetical protein [Saccharomonospora iraqiensis]|uniref:hypothetical protein n=1 Tax=Saccharomonospora iraqiensis TaxID=52698 RepID=UPI00040FCC55|nr:hypothetical protein [Saccharomonospora iraqiensis]